MTKLFDYVLPGATVTLGYAERLLKGIPEGISARKPVVGGTLIETNHPVFVVGHLSLYPQLVAEMSGLPREGLTVPESYRPLFEMGAECKDDPQHSLYPPLAEVSERFFAGMRLLIERVPGISPEKMDALLEHPGRRERFGTVGAFLTYVMLAHPQTHLGQLSVWRRCFGLGPA